MITVNCPNCGASMDIDESREFAFCTFCGTKILTDKKVEIDRNKEINNLLTRAYEYEEKKDYIRAKDYCNRVLDIDSTNEIARALEKRLNEASPIDNIVIKYLSVLKDKFKLRVTLDGRNWITIEPNGESSFRLPLGKHRIFFSGKRNYTRDIVVTDTKKKIEIIYDAQGHRNEIVINQ